MAPQLPFTAPRQQRELERLQGFKQSRATPAKELGKEMLAFFKQAVQKRQTRLSKIAEAWGALVPDTLSAHCSLESLTRGTLAVVVDSSPHLYELKQLLLAGLQDQLLLACRPTGLRKITLKSGRWYASSDDGSPKPKFPA